MKRCPKCNRTYQTDTQKFCTHDGGLLTAFDMAHSPMVPFEGTNFDAPTKAISQELLSREKTFDPHHTSVSPGSTELDTGEVRGAITQDLTRPSGRTQPPTAQEPSARLASSPSEPSSGSLPSTDSETLLSPKLSLPPQAPPRSDSSPITASAPLPVCSSAPLPSPVAVQPMAAPRKKSKAPLILGILVVLFIVGVAAIGVAYVFVFKPMLEARRTPRPVVTIERPEQSSNPSAPASNATPSELENTNIATENEPPPYSPPANAVQFINSNQTLNGKLAEHYVDFSFYYPNDWIKDPMAGIAGASNFVKVERRLPPDFTQENFAVAPWYASPEPTVADDAFFHRLVMKDSADFEKKFPEYRQVLEGPTKIGAYLGYEFRFESTSRNTAKGDLKVWGREIFFPPRPGETNGIKFLILATSLAPELKTASDIGEKGELPMILDSFRFGTTQ